ncbi:type I-F CRISPR-associated protein Csy2 [Niveibacterium terrae]|uniref:type I-F CRISPR-associated protein Csy2 n=1 Tax=Niveibacterium terrae TaxID=3373598 RepID=UPI003A93A09E
MESLPSSSGLLVLPWLRVQSANAISSPLTHGFPAISAFLGLMWALERKLAGRFEIGFDSVGVICHRHEELVTESGYTRAFRLTRNPVGKDGSTAAIVEEGRIHLEITLVFGISGGIVNQSDEARDACAREVAETLAHMRIAGGSVLPSAAGGQRAPSMLVIPEEGAEAAALFRRLRRSWLPGFALVSRDDLVAERLVSLRGEQPKASALDAWLDLSRFNWKPESVEVRDSETGELHSTHIEWHHDRKGWLVPIPVGYGALSPLQSPGAIANARDATTSFRFVESLYSLGEWVAPHRLTGIQQLLWYSHADPDAGLYRVRNDYSLTAESTHSN